MAIYSEKEVCDKKQTDFDGLYERLSNVISDTANYASRITVNTEALKPYGPEADKNGVEKLPSFGGVLGKLHDEITRLEDINRTLRKASDHLSSIV